MVASFWLSLRIAFHGIGRLLRSQRNARIHVVIALVAIVMAAWLRITPVEWALLAVTIGAVLMAEGLNTAIEAVVDLASPEWHPLARNAKDVAAGAVLIMAVASVVVGLILFGGRLLVRLGWS